MNRAGTCLGGLSSGEICPVFATTCHQASLPAACVCPSSVDPGRWWQCCGLNQPAAHFHPSVQGTVTPCFKERGPPDLALAWLAHQPSPAGVYIRSCSSGQAGFGPWASDCCTGFGWQTTATYPSRGTQVTTSAPVHRHVGTSGSLRGQQRGLSSPTAQGVGVAGRGEAWQCQPASTCIPPLPQRASSQAHSLFV